MTLLQIGSPLNAAEVRRHFLTVLLNTTTYSTRFHTDVTCLRVDILCCTKMYLCPEPECASGHNLIRVLRVGRWRIRNLASNPGDYRRSSLGVTPRRQFGCHFLDPDPDRVSSLFSCHLPISPVKPIQTSESIYGECCAGTKVHMGAPAPLSESFHSCGNHVAFSRGLPC